MFWQHVRKTMVLLIRIGRSTVLSQINWRNISGILRMRDIARILKYTRTRAMDGIYIEDEEHLVQEPRVDAEELLIAICQVW